MGAIIKACGTSASPTLGSSIAHAAEAARQCLSTAGVSIDDVEVLINAGVYRDNNMVEPAMSALISRELGLGLDYIKHPTRKTAFTFDLMSGGAGMLNAIQVASAYLATGEAEYVLVVASDAHPSNRRVDGFPYASVGGALLLARGEAGRGFGRVQVATSSAGSPGVTGSLRLGGSVPDGRSRIHVERDVGFEQQALELAVQTARKHAREGGISLAQTTLISSQLSPGFAATLARRLEAAGGVTVDGLDGDPHTSALAFAYAARPAHNHDPLLFVAVGAGLTAACAVYRP
jgi:3-oxoacyl-[acyl-carrier-protein] synthase-3